MTGKFYQFVSGFAVEPIRLDPAYGLKSFTFSVTADQLNTLSARSADHSGIQVRRYREGSCRFRLRCCLLPKAGGSIKESFWAVRDTTWPTEIYTYFNGRPQELPRKQHFHRDQPAELSDTVQAGLNEIKISLPPNKCNVRKDRAFYLAVEIIRIASHGALKAGIESTSHIPSDITKNEIARRLKPDDSNDIIVEDQYLGISLADPFSSVMFEIPVRGIDCKHLECFDLNNWLSTRRSKPVVSKRQEPSVADCWKCPICDLDARPCSLQIDGYFVNVRSALVSSGKSNVKRIRASPDGSWLPEEEPEDSGDEAMPDAGRRCAEAKSSSSRIGSVDIIEILDD